MFAAIPFIRGALSHNITFSLISIPFFPFIHPSIHPSDHRTPSFFFFFFFVFVSVCACLVFIMLCMSCWKEIRDDTAVYTKSCKHVFCQSCSDKAFTSSSSACPRCGNLLPRKEGTATLTLHPSDSHVARIAAQAFGFAPRDLCAVLQKALDFSAQQAANDALKYVHQVSALKQKLEHLAKEHTKVVKVSFPLCPSYRYSGTVFE